MRYPKVSHAPDLQATARVPNFHDAGFKHHFLELDLDKDGMLTKEAPRSTAMWPS
jgi:hypothetical protein